MNDERAATEVLGYILVIALVTVTIAVVMTTGIGGLESSQEAEQINNMERAFDVFEDNQRDIAYDGVETRATELRIGEGTITHGEPVNLSVNVSNNVEEEITTVTTPIVYGHGDTEIVYIAGATMRVDGDHAVMLSEPEHDLDNSRFSIRLPFTSGQGAGAEGETILVRSESVDRTSERYDGGHEVRIRIEEVSEPRTDAWVTYFSRFDEIDDEEITTDGQVIEFMVNSSEFIFHSTEIETSLH